MEEIENKMDEKEFEEEVKKSGFFLTCGEEYNDMTIGYQKEVIDTLKRMNQLLSLPLGSYEISVRISFDNDTKIPSELEGRVGKGKTCLLLYRNIEENGGNISEIIEGYFVPSSREIYIIIEDRENDNLIIHSFW